MKSQHLVFTLALSVMLLSVTARGQWMDFTGGPTNATGTWTGVTNLSGTASVTASNFINGNPNTVQIGLVPFNYGPNLSTDFYAAGLIPNPGTMLPAISAPFNDTGDKYHVEIDFSGTSGPSSSGVLPAGTTFAVIDMDINETFTQMFATDASNSIITTPWLTPLQAYFDATAPIFSNDVSPWQPTVSHNLGAYDMVGNPGNFDSGMMLFQTTQDVKTISVFVEVGGTQGVISGGGAALGFYSPVPEPSTVLLAMVGVSLVCAARCRTQFSSQ